MLQIGEEVEKLKALKLQLGDDNASSGHGAELQEKIKTQGDIVRKLKAEKAEKNLVRIISFITFWLTYSKDSSTYSYQLSLTNGY